MGICGDVAVGVPDQDQVAVTLQPVSGIGDNAVSAAFTGVPSGTGR